MSILENPAIQDIYATLIKCNAHIGKAPVKKHNNKYIYAIRPDGIPILDVTKILHKLVLAARVFIGIDHPCDVLVVSKKAHASRAVLKFCESTGATPLINRFMPGSLTNQAISKISEPRLLIVADPENDRNSIVESTYVGVPVIGFCNSDDLINYIDVVIPINNIGIESIGAGFCLLSKIINFMRGSEDLCERLNEDIKGYFFRDAAEIEKLTKLNEKELKKEGESSDEKVQNERMREEEVPQEEEEDDGEWGL